MRLIRTTGAVLLLFLLAFQYVRSEEPQKVSKMKSVLVSPDLVDFKLIKVGKAGAQMMSITNKGSKSVTIKSAKKIQKPYSVETKLPRAIAPGKTLQVKLVFRREKKEDYQGYVKLIVSQGGDLLLQVREK